MGVRRGEGSGRTGGHSMTKGSIRHRAEGIGLRFRV